jgi:hypothetical protein
MALGYFMETLLNEKYVPTFFWSMEISKYDGSSGIK